LTHALPNTYPASNTTDKIAALRERASCLRAVRSFFHERDIMEVDCPMLGHAAPIDTHIDVMRVEIGENEWGYLHTSPEYGMKRLLAAGVGDCYQLGHVFRLGESSQKHNPEFTMLEWYRLGVAYRPFIEETLDLVRLLLGPVCPGSVSFISYRAALQRYAGVDYVTATTSELLACVHSHGQHLSPEAKSWDKDTLMHVLLGLVVEPHLGQQELLVLHDYPASQAALARTVQNLDETVAERFEIYFRGVELANGYHELTDAAEQRRRLHEEEHMRLSMGKPPLVIDENFLGALEDGLPPCCGVAVGFDRLLMLRLGKTSLDEVLPFSWSES